MDDGIPERLGVCFGEAGLGGLNGGDAALEDVVKLTGLSRNTYYKYKRELKQEAEG